MGRTSTETNEEKDEKTSTKDTASDTDSDAVEEELDEEHFIVEKVIKMRTTKKGKVQCKLNPSFSSLKALFFLQIY